MMNAQQFFSTAEERYRIKLRRDDGKDRPWTDDPVFNTWRFCHVHRENDKTTQWFAKNIRNPLSQLEDKRQIAQATVIFRWFNKIETCEKILDLLLGRWDTEEARRRLQNHAPIVTGAYIIKGPDGYTKLDGILCCIDRAIPDIYAYAPSWGLSLRDAWADLDTLFYIGRFMAYEIVSDLRWTPVLENALDILTWANAGPGCARGLGWVLDGNPRQFDYKSNRHQEVMLGYMQELLGMSRDAAYWPRCWQPWEMREVEHWLCEFDKYKRAESGRKLKRRYK